MSSSRFTSDEQAAVYKAILGRRDIRMYRPEAVPAEVLHRILRAGHAAGSVGMMQPWNFLVLEDRQRRRAVHEHFVACNDRAAAVWSDERQVHYGALKLQGILDAPLNIIITCDHTRGGEQVLGRHTIPETDIYSTCLAVQNMWLAARAEGVGMGWLSIMEPTVVKELLGIPSHVSIIAYMTVGYPIEFPNIPLLEAVGWRQRSALERVVFRDEWNAPYLEADRDPLPEREPEAPSDASFRPVHARERQDHLTKPKGSLGRLEAVALQVCALQRTVRPVLDRARVFLLAGDHGITAEHVSAYMPEMTAKMVIQFVSGGGAINAVARENSLDLSIVDMGVDHDFSLATGVIDAKVRRGTRNFRVEPAMTIDECQLAVDRGAALLESDAAPSIIGLGEMGIGNSTSACAIACATLGLAVADAVGVGTGVGGMARQRKASMITAALDLHRDQLTDPWAILVTLGGYEIAGLVGLIQAAAARSIPVVLDGFITGAAALIAARLDPTTRRVMIAGTRSSEPAHSAILDALELEPLLDLGIRLGEGAAAGLAIPLVRASCRTMAEMCTFEEAGIAEPLDPEGRR
ncbi:MAG: 5,6-dimethylbenzimidazole synthase [Deltaproteobacteria bacterium]|nr:5,6-dimethylbenzimidazole synthase [Deltaproteobacteria bacterium]HCH62255.1 5,6-dimethylbenzimidazole synthase [Deltaproteobacteria bacterium]